MTEGVRTADDVWREIQSKCRQHMEAQPPKPILTYEDVENFITGVGDSWIERHSTSRRAVRENSRTPKSDVVKIWDSLVRNGHTDDVRTSYYYSFALVHRLIDGVSANGASHLYFSDRDKAMQTFEPTAAPALSVREQFLADLRSVQTGWRTAEGSTEAVEPETAAEGPEDAVAISGKGIDDTIAAGVALVNTWWDASAQARVDHPEPGPERNLAFKEGHALWDEGLTALGLPVLKALPSGRKAAMAEAERRFRAFLATEGPARPGRQRWLHKPLLLLVCFGRCAHQEGRMVRFVEIEEELTELLRLYDPPGSSASEPFWRLQYDGSLWVLEGENLDELTASASPPPATRLRDHKVRGGLSKPYYDAVVLDRSLLSEAVTVVITTFLPMALWEPIRDRFGFSIPEDKARVAETEMTIELAMEESERAFRSCERRHAPRSQERNECFAAQAHVFLTRLEALGAIHHGEVVVSPEEVGAARHEKLVNYVRMSGKNIELANGRYGWTPPRDPQ